MSVDLDRRTDRHVTVPVRLIPMNSKQTKRKRVTRLKQNNESDEGNTRIEFLQKVNYLLKRVLNGQNNFIDVTYH